jgi:hypothetical protein
MTIHATTSTWVLETQATAYAFGLSDNFGPVMDFHSTVRQIRRVG